MPDNEKEASKELSVEELKSQLEESEKKSAEYLAGWQRARADFLNYKKEEMERIEGLLKYAEEEFVLRILPIMDNFDLVEKKLPEDLNNNEYVKGIFQIKSQFQGFLKNQNVEEINVVGEKFDPNLHEVVGEEDGEEPGVIIEEVQKGYKINGRLLRPAKVKVNR